MKHSLAAQMQTTLAPVVKKRVAAYARVSTEHEEQQTSYDAQVDYYTQKIKERTDWVFVEVYTEMLTKTKARCCTHRAFFASKCPHRKNGSTGLYSFFAASPPFSIAARKSAGSRP